MLGGLLVIQVTHRTGKVSQNDHLRVIPQLRKSFKSIELPDKAFSLAIGVMGVQLSLRDDFKRIIRPWDFIVLVTICTLIVFCLNDVEVEVFAVYFGELGQLS